MISLNLKLIFLLALVAVVFDTTEAVPKKEIENKACNILCAQFYDPVCGQDLSVKGSKPRTFGNECTLKVHNCEHKADMKVIYKGECKNSGGVRLS